MNGIQSKRTGRGKSRAGISFERFSSSSQRRSRPGRSRTGAPSLGPCTARPLGPLDLDVGNKGRIGTFGSIVWWLRPSVSWLER